MRQLLASVALAAAALLVATGIATAGPARIEGEPARVERVLPHAALVTFADGGFFVVPRSALHEGAARGDLLDLRHRPLPDERLAAFAPPSAPLEASDVKGAERRRPTW